jgi:energy-coupling factor transport system permease protein
MRDRLSFYILRESPIHRMNPLTKLTLVFSLILLAFLGPVEWLAILLFTTVILPLSFLAHVGREFLSATARLLLPVIGFLFVMQSIFLPGGGTALVQVWVLDITLENVNIAFVNATRILTMISSFLLLLLTTHPSALMSDLARRGVPGPISYTVTSTLQILPQMQVKAATIMDAQRARGLETQGNLMKRIRALLPLVAPLVFGSLVDVEERAIAIEARAFNSPRQKTSLVEIDDRPIDRRIRWGLILVVIFLLGSRLWLK